MDIADQCSFYRAVRCVKRGGSFLMTNPNTLFKLVYGPLVHLLGGKCVAMKHLAELLDQGVLKAHIDREYALSEMQEAHRYVEANMKGSSLTIRMPEG